MSDEFDYAHAAYLTVKSAYVSLHDFQIAAMTCQHDVDFAIFAVAEPFVDEYPRGDAQTTYRVTGDDCIRFAWRWREERELRGDGRV